MVVKGAQRCQPHCGRFGSVDSLSQSQLFGLKDKDRRPRQRHRDWIQGLCSNQIEIYQVRQRHVLLVFPVSLEKCCLPGSAWLHCKRSILIPLTYFVFQISSASSVYEP